MPEDVFVLGDSIALHYGPFLEEALRPTFRYVRKEGALERMDEPQGANGGDSEMVVEYLRQRAETSPIRARYLLVNCGLHDIKVIPPARTLHTPEAVYARNLERIIELAKTMAPLVWLTTTPVVTKIHNKRMRDFGRFAADVKTYNKIAANVMAAHEIPIIDLHAFTRQFIPDGYADHVHFKPNVRAAQGRWIAAAVRDGFPPHRS